MRNHASTYFSVFARKVLDQAQIEDPAQREKWASSAKTYRSEGTVVVEVAIPIVVVFAGKCRVEVDDSQVAVTMQPLHWRSFRGGDSFVLRAPRAGVAYATLRWDLVMDTFDLCAAVEEAANEANETDEESDDDES
jgi:hypothetical protein